MGTSHSINDRLREKYGEVYEISQRVNRPFSSSFTFKTKEEAEAYLSLHVGPKVLETTYESLNDIKISKVAHQLAAATRRAIVDCATTEWLDGLVLYHQGLLEERQPSPWFASLLVAQSLFSRSDIDGLTARRWSKVALQNLQNVSGMEKTILLSGICDSITKYGLPVGFIQTEEGSLGDVEIEVRSKIKERHQLKLCFDSSDFVSLLSSLNPNERLIELGKIEDVLRSLLKDSMTAFTTEECLQWESGPDNLLHRESILSDEMLSREFEEIRTSQAHREIHQTLVGGRIADGSAAVGRWSLRCLEMLSIDVPRNPFRLVLLLQGSKSFFTESGLSFPGPMAPFMTGSLLDLLPEQRHIWTFIVRRCGGFREEFLASFTPGSMASFFGELMDDLTTIRDALLVTNGDLRRQRDLLDVVAAIAELIFHLTRTKLFYEVTGVVHFDDPPHWAEAALGSSFWFPERYSLLGSATLLIADLSFVMAATAPACGKEIRWCALLASRWSGKVVFRTESEARRLLEILKETTRLDGDSFTSEGPKLITIKCIREAFKVSSSNELLRHVSAARELIVSMHKNGTPLRSKAVSKWLSELVTLIDSTDDVVTKGNVDSVLAAWRRGLNYPERDMIVRMQEICAAELIDLNLNYR